MKRQSRIEATASFIRALRTGSALTIAQAKAALALHGMILKKTNYNEYRVNFRGGNEDSAYYTDDIVDAVNTGILMAARKRS